MGSRRLTTAEAIAYALDPRNDNGEKNQLHVMAFRYDSDCPNYADHTMSVLEGPDGKFWNRVDQDWVDEADATEYTRAEADAFDPLDLPYGTRGWIHDACRDWDGILPDDVESSLDEDGNAKEDEFAEWGPFQLVFDIEPGPARDFTPEEALDAIQSRLEAFESGVGNYGMSMRMSRAVDAIHKFLVEGNDLEWGEPLDCAERLNEDPDYDDPEFLNARNAVTAAKDSLRVGALEEAEAAFDDIAKKLGYGRHYGDPHCIWCLQAS